ncbi:MAG: hypothetical protein LC800_16260, partial [Acidobacteria bacterium]|nr:hypothetical protein [Acidobacteriota bacterium]
MKKMPLLYSLLCLIALCPAAARAQQNALVKASPSVSPTPAVTPAATPAPADVKTAEVPATDSLPAAGAKPAATGKGATVALPPEKAAPVRIPKFDKVPVIDGKLDDDIWKSAAVLSNFYQTRPGDNIAPSKQTEV